MIGVDEGPEPYPATRPRNMYFGGPSTKEGSCIAFGRVGMPHQWQPYETVRRGPFEPAGWATETVRQVYCTFCLEVRTIPVPKLGDRPPAKEVGDT